MKAGFLPSVYLRFVRTTNTAVLFNCKHNPSWAFLKKSLIALCGWNAILLARRYHKGFFIFFFTLFSFSRLRCRVDNLSRANTPTLKTAEYVPDSRDLKTVQKPRDVSAWIPVVLAEDTVSQVSHYGPWLLLLLLHTQCCCDFVQQTATVRHVCFLLFSSPN